jgi:carboxyl-terminal processing protease
MRAMQHSPRHRALVVALAFVTGATVSLTFGSVSRLAWHSQPIRAAFATQNELADTSRSIGLFADVFERVIANYVDPVGGQSLIEIAINGMLAKLDPYSSYMDARALRDLNDEAEGRIGGIGVDAYSDAAYARVISAIDGTPASRAGIQAGDLIVAVDGESIRNWSPQRIIHRMRGPPHSTIVLSIQRDGVDHPLQVSVVREIITLEAVSHRLIAPDIGYIRLRFFNEHADEDLRAAVEMLKREAGQLHAIILDLRDNPGGSFEQAVMVSGEFLNRGDVVSLRARRPEDSGSWHTQGNDITNGLPLLLLINEGSASAAEIVAGALQDNRRAILVGARSFGKGSAQTLIPLADDRALKLTTAYIYTPSGRLIQGFGISPDVPVAQNGSVKRDFEQEKLNRALSIQGGTSRQTTLRRADLPAIIRRIPKNPPHDFPTYSPNRAETDFQLQQALVLARAIAAGQTSPIR